MQFSYSLHLSCFPAPHLVICSSSHVCFNSFLCIISCFTETDLVSWTNAEVWGHLFIYILFVFRHLIELSSIFPSCGYKLCHSFSQDSQKTCFYYRCSGRAGKGQDKKIYVCWEKHDPGSLLPVSTTSFPLPWGFISTIFQPGVLEPNKLNSSAFKRIQMLFVCQSCVELNMTALSEQLCVKNICYIYTVFSLWLF